MHAKHHDLFSMTWLLAVWFFGLTLHARAQNSKVDRHLSGSESYDIRIGTTVSRQGSFAKISANIEKAFRLVEEVVNAKRPFKSQAGGNITVKFTMHDDASDSATVRSLFTQMSASDDFDVLLAPYSSGLSLEAAKITDVAGKILMMHNAASPSIYVNADGSPRFQYVFASNPMAYEYFQDGLELMRSLGARTIALARGSALFHNAVCDGALGSAQSLGYEVLDDFAIDGSDLTAGIRKCRALDPDVFVGCGHLSNVISIAVTSRALGFSPKAMLLTSSTTKAFVDAVEARNANFIMGPVTWVKEAESRFCKVFGSSQNFHDMYMARWGLAPSYHAGMAALSAVIIMNAAELVGTASPSQDALRTILLESEIDTFAGNVSYNYTGQRIGVKSHTQQIIPDPDAASPAERYTQSYMDLVTGSNPPLFPAPTWEQRELMVYPCAPGYMRDRSSTNVADCVACPQGRSRNNASLVCIPCGANAYSDRPGLSECHPCKVGMNCSEGYFGDPLSLSGYYRIFDRKADEFSFFSCDPPSLCLGANLCAGKNLGVLCDDCPPGYSNKGWGALGEVRALCGECLSNWFSVLWFMALVVLYLAYIFILSVCDHASSHSLAALHGVILKIVINYGQFMSTMLVATEFPIFLEYPFLRNGVEFLLNPLQSMLTFDCVAEKLNIAPEQASIIIGFLLLPVGLGLSAIFFAVFCLLCIRNVRHRRTRHLHTLKDDANVPSMFDVRSEILTEFATKLDGTGSRSDATKSGKSGRSAKSGKSAKNGKSAKSARSDASKLATAQTGVSDETSGSSDTEDELEQSVESDGFDSVDSKSSVYSSFGQAKPEWGLPRVRLRDLTRMMNPNAEQEIKKHLGIIWTRTAVISVYILHPIAIRMLLVGIDCVQLDELRLKKNLGIVCNEATHRWGFASGIFGIIAYGVGVPLVTWKILYSIRDRLLHIDARRKYGFLYNGFENSYYNFEVWYMVRKFLILFAIAIPEIYARILTMLWMAFFFMGAQIVCRPWDNRGYFIFDKLETLSLLALIMSLALRLGLELRSDVTGNLRDFMNSDGYEYFCISCALIPHILFCTLAAWSLMRNTFVKKLMFRKEILPGSLSHFQMFLCRMEETRCHRMTMEPRSHQIDVAGLGHREKELLQSCLNATLEHYMSADLSARSEQDEDIPSLLHFEYLGCAIREAFHRCEKSRRKKMRKLVREVRDKQKASHMLAPWILDLGEDVPFKTVRDEIDSYVKKIGVTVEELQVSLMISWPDIVSATKKKYYTLATHEDKEFTLNEEARRDRLIWAPGRSLAKMVDILERRQALVKDTTKEKCARMSKTEVMETFTCLGLEPARCSFRPADFGDDPIGQYQATLEEAMELHEEIENLKKACARTAIDLDAETSILPSSMPQGLDPNGIEEFGSVTTAEATKYQISSIPQQMPREQLLSDAVQLASTGQVDGGEINLDKLMDLQPSRGGTNFEKELAVDVRGARPKALAEKRQLAVEQDARRSSDPPVLPSADTEISRTSNLPTSQTIRPSPIESAFAPCSGVFLSSVGSQLPRSSLTPLETQI